MQKCMVPELMLQKIPNPQNCMIIDHWYWIMITTKGYCKFPRERLAEMLFTFRFKFGRLNLIVSSVLFQGANFRDLSGVIVGPDNVARLDPTKERVLLPSGRPLVRHLTRNHKTPLCGTIPLFVQILISLPCYGFLFFMSGA